MRVFEVTINGDDVDLKLTSVFKQAKRMISDIKFSPDNKMMVYGAHDDTIYALALPSYKNVCRPMKKHSSFITHIDFSKDGNCLHSTCGAYELLFWEVHTGK